MALPPPEPDEEQALEEEPGDWATPFSPPDDIELVMTMAEEDMGMLDEEQPQARLDPTHPATDDGIEEGEWYGEGLPAAADAQEPNAGNAVIGYARPADKLQRGGAMATTKQREAARENIKKAQAAWKGMSHRQHALAQPEGRRRAKPGTKGEGGYYRVIVRPKDEFVTFRFQDVGDPGHLQRLSGHRSSGSWATHAWLIAKEDAHVEGDTLVPDSDDARDLLQKLGSEPRHEKGDIFTAKDRRNVPEREKPTLAQQRARSENIKKAQAARRDSGA